MLDKLNEKFTLAAVRLDQRVSQCSLLNIPESKWVIYTRFVCLHSAVATFLFVFGVICFCLGMQYSGMYTEVNCSDGTNIWIPLLNLLVSFVGLFALRTLHMHWPAFIHFLSLSIILIMMIAPIIDSGLATSRWFHRSKHPFDCWASNFTWIDLTLSLLAVINELVCIVLMILLFKYWFHSDLSSSSPSNNNSSTPSTVISHS